MNLQQQYDLIGQILKERPELADKPVLDIAGATIINIATYNDYVWLNCFPQIEEGVEILWQHQ